MSVTRTLRRGLFCNGSFLGSVSSQGIRHKIVKSYGTSSTGSGADASKDETVKLQEKFKRVMRNVPQPVVVVTTAKFDKQSNQWLKRGATCSSFTNISLSPPIVSFAMGRPSRLHDYLLDTNRFSVHVLSKDQVGHAVHFAKAATDGVCQFQAVKHELNTEGIPHILECSAILDCERYAVTDIGDHHVWYGRVTSATQNGVNNEPMLYYLRSFWHIGDITFMQAFEDRTLPFEEWTHEAHLRMAFNYIREFGKEEAVTRIKTGIKSYNEKNKEKIDRGYHETVTMFYIHMVGVAMQNYPSWERSFEQFIRENDYLLQKDFLFRYYSPGRISSKEAKAEFVSPDREALP